MTSSSKSGTKTPTKSAFKPIRTLVAENESIAPMLRQLEVISRLQKTYADIVPTSLNEVSRVAAVEGSTIIVAVTNGNAATILKQILPRLLQQFRENKKQEQEVTSIKVIVQPPMTAGAGQIVSRVTGVNPTGPSSDKSMGQLADSLADSPLKETVIRIQQRRARTENRVKKP